jgi:insulin-like growth factor 2 mRNA-binding protein 1
VRMCCLNVNMCTDSNTVLFGLSQQETTYLYIPNNAVGAIIGTKGTHIRNIIRLSGASVKIAALEQDKPLEQQTRRKVTIVGTAEAQWKVSVVYCCWC